MTVSRKSSDRFSEPSSSIGSDLAKVDAHVIDAKEYEELPEVTDEWLAGATVHDNGKPLHPGRGRPRMEKPKQQVTLRLDADVLAGIRATGAGWHGRVNDALRDWLLRRRQS